jgi:hypothetical protein
MLSKIVALSLAAAASAFAPAALPGRVTSRGEQRHTLAQQLRRGALRGSEHAAARRGIWAHLEAFLLQAWRRMCVVAQGRLRSRRAGVEAPAETAA